MSLLSVSELQTHFIFHDIDNQLREACALNKVNLTLTAGKSWVLLVRLAQENP